MADPESRLSDNVPGKYYVDDQCIDCDACRETAPDFFARLEVPRVKALLADLETITPEDAVDDDYIDLAEDAQYKMEVQEGECSA